MEKETSHQRAKHLKYKKLNKAFSKKKTRIILDDPSESDSSSSSEGDNSPDEGEKSMSTTQSRVTVKKAATSLPTPKRKPEPVFVEMDL